MCAAKTTRAQETAATMDIASLFEKFSAPPQSYRAIPLLRINDAVDPAQLRWQLESLKTNGFGGIFLLCEHMGESGPDRFLSPWWWSVVDQAARMCAEIGLEFWVYDEEDWPSGSAGGQLTEAHPEFRWKYLHAAETLHQNAGPVRVSIGEGELVAAVAFRMDRAAIVEDSLTDLTDRVTNGLLEWDVPGGTWHIAIYTARPGVGIFLDGYSDLMDKNATSAFVDWVYRAHDERVKQIPGIRIEGFFTDEPAFSYAMIQLGDRFHWYPSMPYTPGLGEAFQTLHGYDWRPLLPLLYHQGGPTKIRFTCHYWDACRHLYRENYFGQIYRFCEQNGMKATGHLVVEEDFHNHLAQQAGNLPGHFRYMHIPGMDWIHPFEDTFRRLPATTPKYPVSMAHLMGRERAWAESFAASGWGLDPRSMRRIVNWEHVNGISMQIPICYKFSLRGGDRAQFYVPGISYQQPYWDHIRGFADYEARLCVLTGGDGHVAQVALAYPEVDIWTHCWEHALLHERSASYNRLGDIIRFAGYDFDILDDEAFLKQSHIKGHWIKTETERFEIVMVPGVDAVRKEVLAYWLDFVRKGGCVLFVERLPRHSYEAGGDDPEVQTLLDDLLGPDRSLGAPFWRDHGSGGRAGFAPSVEDVGAMLPEVADPDLIVDGNGQFVAYHRRLDDAHLYLVYNDSDEAKTVRLRLGGRGIAERWLPETGACQPIDWANDDNAYSVIVLAFQPYELIPIVLRALPSGSPAVFYERIHEIPIKGPFRFSAEETFHRPEVAWNFSIDSEGLEYSRTTPAVGPAELPLGDWQTLGLANFSGIGRYETSFDLPAAAEGRRILLELGRVGNTAEAFVNGDSAGIAFFEPYSVDITQYVRIGTNHLAINVANTLSNYMAQFPRYENQDLARGGDFPERRVSGLLGPVKVAIEESILEEH
jgi:hypothetical protein